MHFLEGLTIGDQEEKERHDREPKAFVEGKHRCQRRGCGRVALSDFAFMLLVLKTVPPTHHLSCKIPRILEIARLLIFKRNTVHFHMG